ncbi:MAG: Ribosomal protein acetylase RimI and related acetyltransferase [Gemmatimonadetes bacterium]|jgi:GNAT superfamily N-acetyltransferase|nr:Ribosomal protein acetylase RimI and related acetyltransferase [Gemmatimonadota bacterium]
MTTSAPSLTVSVVPRSDHQSVTPLLLLAEPSYSALRWSLENLSDTIYRFDVDGTPAGAATMRWRDDPAELVELAVVADQQGRGIGHQIIDWLVDEGRRRGVAGIEVGTRSTALENIAFYQKCGFRPLSVRRDYFWYYAEPVVEHGIVVRDMLVFERQLVTPPPGPLRQPRRPATRR